MQKPKILLLGSIAHAESAWQSLSSLADIVEPDVENRQHFLQKCATGGLDGIVAIYRTFYSASITGNLDRELIAALPPSVKFICHSGAGYDQIDIAACTARGVQVSNCPAVVDDATADTAAFLILGCVRGFSTGLKTARDGKWRGTFDLPLGHDLRGRTCGILGLGRIGLNVARKMKAFGMKVVYHSRRQVSSSAADAQYVDLERLLRTSDVISIHMPLNEQTRHLISRKEFAMMKDNVVIVNTARGPIIDEQALVDALGSGKVWSCGLDVYENEPQIHPGLLFHPRALLLPHLGTYTVETHTEMELRCIANMRAALESGRVQDLVSEQVSVEFGV